MTKKIFFIFLIFSAFLYGGVRQNLKIVCLAPNLCEILFSLDAGNLVVGVSDFCEYPPECKKKPRVGGLIDPNFEAIVKLGSNTAFLVPEQKWIEKRLKVFGIKSYIFKDYSVGDILNTILEIGKIVGKEVRARNIVNSMVKKINFYKAKSRDIKIKKKILLVVGRDIGSFRNLYVAGKGTFLDEIISLSGGENCYNGKLKYPQLNIESLYDLNPDVIVELLPDEENLKKEILLRKKDWEKLKGLRAVKNNKIFFTNDTSFVVPGIRFLKAVKILKGFLKND